MIKECSEFKRKRYRYFVSDDCVWLQYDNHIFLTSCEYMNEFYRRYIRINDNTMQYLSYNSVDFENSFFNTNTR